MNQIYSILGNATVQYFSTSLDPPENIDLSKPSSFSQDIAISQIDSNLLKNENFNLSDLYHLKQRLKHHWSLLPILGLHTSLYVIGFWKYKMQFFSFFLK